MSLNIDGIPFISEIKTNDNGLLSYTYADGTKHTRTYDENGRVKELSYPNYIEKVNYNVVSNITNIQSDAISRAFGYDNLDRLTSYEQNATDFQNFAYDGNGNRLSQSQEENSSKTFDYLANSNILNTIQETKGTDTKEISYEYDETGNIIKDDKHTYSYDGRNRLTAIDNNVTYQYNYDNKRVSKTVNGVKTYFLYDGHMLIGEYQLNLSDQSRQEMVYLKATPFATVTPTGTYRIYSDHLDTSRRVAMNDELAEVLWEWESKPFGESLANDDVDQDGKAFTLNLRFPGQYFDSETKTHYNINRDYNPVIGRYIQSDPIGFDGGVNGFGYVLGNPLTLDDKNGENPLAILVLFFLLGDEYSNAPSIDEEPLSGFTPMREVAFVLVGGNLYRTPTTLYHYTTRGAAEKILKDGLSVGPSRMYGRGVYATRYQSRFMATLQGAASTEAKITIQKTYQFRPTLFPGTFKTRGTSVPSKYLWW